MLYYAILYDFGTNLLTQSPVPVYVFSLFLSFVEKEYQTESKRNKTFAMIFLGPEDTQETWRSSQKSHEAATRVEGVPRGVGCAPLPRGPLGALLTQFLRLYILLYPKNSRGSHENTFPPPQPSVPVRSHLGAFFGVLPEGDSIMEGFYINTITLLIKREQFTTDLRVHSQQLDGFFSLFDSQYHVLLDDLGDLFDVILFCDVFAEMR